MSKQLSFSATASVLAMVLFALVAGLGGMSDGAATNSLMTSPLSAVSN